MDDLVVGDVDAAGYGPGVELGNCSHIDDNIRQILATLYVIYQILKNKYFVKLSH